MIFYIVSDQYLIIFQTSGFLEIFWNVFDFQSAMVSLAMSLSLFFVHHELWLGLWYPVGTEEPSERKFLQIKVKALLINIHFTNISIMHADIVILVFYLSLITPPCLFPSSGSVLKVQRKKRTVVRHTRQCDKWWQRHLCADVTPDLTLRLRGG